MLLVLDLSVMSGMATKRATTLISPAKSQVKSILAYLQQTKAQSSSRQVKTRLVGLPL